MMYKAIATDKNTGETTVIETEATSKNDFIQDLRNNGYSVNPIKVHRSDKFDWILNNYDDFQDYADCRKYGTL